MPRRQDDTAPIRTSRRCGAMIRGRRKPGGPSAAPRRYCALPAGSGTDHPGIGRCRKHGGNRKQELTSAGVQLAHHYIMDPDVAVDAIIDIEPGSALLWAARSAYTVAQFWQGTAANAQLRAQDGELEPEEAQAAWSMFKEAMAEFTKARRETAQIGKMAMDAGIAERHVAMQQRATTLVARILNEVVAQLPLTRDQRELMPDLLRAALLNSTGELPGELMKKPQLALVNLKKEDIIEGEVA